MPFSQLLPSEFELCSNQLCFILLGYWYRPTLENFVWELIMMNPVILKSEQFCSGNESGDGDYTRAMIRWVHT